MHGTEGAVERQIVTSHDGQQHCTTVRKPDGNRIAMDCPYTGKGEEFSPTNMVEAALGGCMLLSMGPQAMNSNLDISGTDIEVKISMTDKPHMRFGAIDIKVTMPQGLSEKHRKRLERAAEYCPIKHSFAPDIPISVEYIYPD
ncbi:OsmC family protein [Planctomycetota bacterium]